MSNIEVMLQDLNANDKLRINGDAYGYRKLPSVDAPFTIHLFGCKYCGCVVWCNPSVSDLLDATKHGLVIHGVHCTGISLGSRVVRANRAMEGKSDAVLD